MMAEFFELACHKKVEMFARTLIEPMNMEWSAEREQKLIYCQYFDFECSYLKSEIMWFIYDFIWNIVSVSVFAGQ